MAKIKVYTVVYNKPEFLVLQYQNLKKFCTDVIDYHVVNNSVDNPTRITVSKICSIFGIKEINFHQEDRHPYCSHDHIQALEYLYFNYIDNDNESDIRVVMDSDIFPFKPFSFYTIMNNHDIVGLSMRDYYSAIYTQYSKNVNLEGFNINSYCADSGSGTGHLLKKYKHIGMIHTAPIRELEANYIFADRKEGSMPYDSSWGIQILANSMIHYYRGTGWDNSAEWYYNNKFNFILHLMNNPELYNMKLDEVSAYEMAHVHQWVEPWSYRLNDLNGAYIKNAKLSDLYN